MLKVRVADRQDALAIDRRLVVRMARLAAPPEWKDAELSIALVGYDEMTALNRQFTGRAGDTDVLAFELEDPSRPGKAMVGEVVAGVARAQKESAARADS